MATELNLGTVIKLILIVLVFGLIIFFMSGYLNVVLSKAGDFAMALVRLAAG